MSKDEASGEVAPKPVTKTFVRVAPATLAFTFSNGETVETTVEHPFYVQDKGFTPAGLVALGNSIATRAGPGLQVTGVEKKNAAQTVYNFSVAEFHTYFVGNSGLWVHNASYHQTIYENYLRHIGKLPLPANYAVHHKIPQRVFADRPDIATALMDMGLWKDHPQNLVGVPAFGSAAGNIHQEITNLWQDWFRLNPNYTLGDVMTFRGYIQERFASHWY